MKKISLLAISFMMALSAPLSAEYVTIGTGTSSSYYYPYGTGSCYSTTQSIYTAAEMGGAKKIETIAYQVASAGALSTTQIKIYMGHTTKSYFSSSSNYENVSGMTLVYSGSPTLAASTGWEEFTLTTPFGYDGTRNLVVVVAKQASSQTSGSYYYSSTSNAQCLYIADNYSSSYGDATTFNNFYTSTGRANVRFGTFDLTQDGIGYMFASDTEANVVGCTATTGAVTIPATVTKDGKTYRVTSIGNSAFYGCSGLTSINIPSGVTSIGKYAFYGCSGLTSISIPSSVTSIGNDAFTGCTSIKEVKIEDGTTTLKLGYKSNSSNSSYYYGLFKDCPIEKLYLGRNLSYSTHSYDSSYPGYGAPFESQSQMRSVEIGKNVTSINNYAFYGCSGLTSISIPSGVTSIGHSAFYGCTGKLIVNCNIGNGSSSDYGWFYGSEFSSLEIGKDVTKIGSYAFYGCSGLTSISIPSGVTSIGYSAFYGCSGLTSISIPSSVTSIGDYAFYGCLGLTSLTIPSSITSIGSSAFYGCSGLTSISIPSSVTSIGYSAFAN